MKKVLANFISFIRPSFRNQSMSSINYGAYNATADFQRSMLNFGTWDEYHIVSVGEPIEALKGVWEEVAQEIRSYDRIKIIPYYEFLENASQGCYTAILEPEGFLQLSGYRLFLPHLPPITGHTHTISYNYLASAMLSAMMLPTANWDGIICTSCSAKCVLEKLIDNLSRSPLIGSKLLFQPKLEVIPFGIDLNRFQPRDSTPIRKLFHIDPDHFVLTYVGRVSIRDKMDLMPALILLVGLLEAKPDLKILLYICGADHRGDHMSDLTAVIQQLNLQSHVRIKTNLQEHEKPLIYNASDLFLSLSDNVQETFGLTILEALASGLPVLASDWDGYRNNIVHNETGFLIPTVWRSHSSEYDTYLNVFPWEVNHFRMAQSLAVDIPTCIQTILGIYERKEQWQEMSEKCVEYARRHFHWKNVVKKTEDFWEELYQIYCTSTQKKEDDSGRNRSPIYRNFVHEFDHYPTEFLSDSQRVRVSRFGQKVKSNWLLFHQLANNILLNYINPKDVSDILLQFENSDQSFSVLELSDSFLSDESKSSLHFDSILWMLKYNILEKVD